MIAKGANKCDSHIEYKLFLDEIIKILLLSDWLQRRVRSAFTKKQLLRKLPILAWLPKYTFSYLASDLIAGITVGLTVIPQGIAYAGVAGLPPQVGTYNSQMEYVFKSCIAH